MKQSRSLRQPQYNTINTININNGLGITVPYNPSYGIPNSPTLPEPREATPSNVTMRSQTGMMGLAEAEYGANFLQLTPAASRFRPGAVIGPASATPFMRNKVQLGISTTNSLDRQPTLFTKDASPQRKAAELNNALGNATTGRLSTKAKLLPSHPGHSKGFKAAPASPVILLERAKTRSRVELDLLLDSSSCVEGGYVKGTVLLHVSEPKKKEGPLYLGEGKVRVVGFEAIPHNNERHTFYHCVAPMEKISPFYHILYTSPPDDEGFCRGREGKHSVPFAMRLPQRQTNFPVAKGVYDSRVNHASIRYIAMFSIKIKDTRTNARSIAHFYRSIEVWPLFDPAVILAPAPTPLYASTSKSLFLGGAGTVKLTASLHRPTWVAGQRCYVRIFVANDTEKRGVQMISLTLIRSETIFEPNSDAAVVSPTGTRIDNDLDACRTSTFKRIVAKSMLEMGEKVTARHATAKGWWTGVEPGTSQEFNHFILLPPFALTISRSRLIEVSFLLEISVSTGPLASDVTVQLPVRIINNISLDPPPAFGPPEKLRNLPLPSNVAPTTNAVESLNSVPVPTEVSASNAAVRNPHLSPNVDRDSETLGHPHPSYICTDSGTYRGDDEMPTLGRLEVRNRASVVSGTMDGQSSSGISQSAWEMGDCLTRGLGYLSGKAHVGYLKPEQFAQTSRSVSAGRESPEKVTGDHWGNMGKTLSLEEYLQGPKPSEFAQVAQLSISPDQALGVENTSDEEVNLVVRSVDPNCFEMDEEQGEIEASQPFKGDFEENRDRLADLYNVVLSARNISPIASQQSYSDASAMFFSGTPSCAGSKPSSTDSSRVPPVLDNKSSNMTAPTTQTMDLPPGRNPLSPPRTRFLPQRPRPHPVLATRTRNTAASNMPGGIPHSKGTTPRSSLDLSRTKVNAPISKPSLQSAAVGSPYPYKDQNRGPTASASRPGLARMPGEANHTKSISSTTADNIPTTVSALMLKNLKTPVPAHPALARGKQESTFDSTLRGLAETRRFGSQTVGPSTRIPPLGGGSSIKSRIAMFEQGQIHNAQIDLRSRGAGM